MKIFPAYGLENSLLTAIFVGLYVRFFFTEWLGWVFSGLVVPGYLACIVLLAPASAAVIILEAIITFALVRGLSQFLSRTRLGSPLFGRDRFVWLVVASVGVRVAVESLIAPWLESHLRARYGWDPSDSFGFYGIGLVLVPLLANACWKPGLLRGSFQQFVCTGITYLLILSLLHTTNLSFAKVAHGFDQTTLDFTASPKAYLLLLAGILVASRANLRFGWDTSGVVIPGLLALAWFSPGRLLATIGESLLIVMLASLFIRLPKVRDWNLEGPRRVVLFFTFGYIVKFCIVAVFGASPLGFEPTALFGIGYLLPSLLAVKILQKRNPMLILFPSITLSMIGLAFGSIVGYALLLSGAALQARQTGAPNGHEEGSCGGTVDLVSEVRLARVRTARTAPNSLAPRISTSELSSLSGMVRQLRTLTAQGVLGCSRLAAQMRPGTLGLGVQAATSPNGRGFFVLREQTLSEDRLRGFGMVAISAKPTGGPVLILDRPDQDLTDLSALVSLVDALSADAILIGGLPATSLGRGNALADRDIALRAASDAIGGPHIKLRTQPGNNPRVGTLVPAVITQALTTKLPTLLINNSGHASSDIELTPATEQILAAPLIPGLATFSSTANWLAVVPVLPRSAPSRSALSDLLLADEVIRPLARAHVPVDLTALGQSVAGAAHELGLSVALVDIAGARPAIGLFGHGEGLLLDPAATDGALIEVVSRRRGVAELSSALFHAQSGHALLIAVTIPGAPDSGPLARVAAPLLALTPPLPPAVVVRASTLETPDCAIVSDTPTDPSPLANGLNATLASIGIHCEPHSQYEIDNSDPPSQIVNILRARTKRDFVTLYVGPELRERYRPAPLSQPQLILFSRLKVPSIRGSLDHVLSGICTDHPAAPVAIAESLVRDARSFAATRNPAVLERLHAEAEKEHLALRAIDDEDQGEVYLLISGMGGAAAIPMRPASAARSCLPCSSDVSAKVRQAQSMSAASIAVGDSSCRP